MISKTLSLAFCWSVKLPRADQVSKSRRSNNVGVHSEKNSHLYHWFANGNHKITGCYDGNSAFNGDQWPLNIKLPGTRAQNLVNIGNFSAIENKKITIQVQNEARPIQYS